MKTINKKHKQHFFNFQKSKDLLNIGKDLKEKKKKVAPKKKKRLFVCPLNFFKDFLFFVFQFF